MAVIAYEVDQLWVPPTGDAVSIPTITAAYNQHCTAFLLNTKRERLVLPRNSSQVIGEAVSLGLTHGSDTHWTPQVIMNDCENDLVDF
jgi:hypothetical protein